jgi:Uncharacterised protein family (UPF0220)
MITLKNILIGFFTGIILTLGWFIFIDGQITSHDAFPALHILPPLFTTISAILVNLATLEQLNEKTIVKVWTFFWFTVQAVCIGSAIFILSTEYPPDANYPGIALMMSCILIMFATVLFFVGKSDRHF